MMRFLSPRWLYGVIFYSLFSIAEIDPKKCGYAQALLGQAFMVCHNRASFSRKAESSGIYFHKSVGYRDIFKVPDLFPLEAKMISLYNEDNAMVMAQFIFPANDKVNSYRQIRMGLDRQYGFGRRVEGSERSPVFEYRWHLRDGVMVRFSRREGRDRARLTFSRPYMVKAFLARRGEKSSIRQH